MVVTMSGSKAVNSNEWLGHLISHGKRHRLDCKACASLFPIDR